MGQLLMQDETYRILGACFDVYKRMGCGFLEPVYQECLGIEFGFHSIPYVEQKILGLKYRDRALRLTYKADFVCFDKVLLEIKAVEELADAHRAQVLNYLHASGLQVGLLVNFGHSPAVQHERFVV
ncbi:GxxExxY protein [bacterium]|nr:GxxExxY protein [bacterium]